MRITSESEEPPEFWDDTAEEIPQPGVGFDENANQTAGYRSDDKEQRANWVWRLAEVTAEKKDKDPRRRSGEW